MQITAIEGIVENGMIRLLDGNALPENAKVYVIRAAELRQQRVSPIQSPRLVNRDQMDEFRKVIVERPGDGTNREPLEAR